MEQQKTGCLVVVPIMDEKLEILLEKYDYNVPSITDQEFNRTIKEVGRKLSTTVPSLSKKERTLLKKQEKQAEERGQTTFERDSKGWVLIPRWQLISSHTYLQKELHHKPVSVREVHYPPDDVSQWSQGGAHIQGVCKTEYG